MSELLKVRNLNVDFLVKKEQIHVVNDVSFDVQEGEVLAIIGETGCRKISYRQRHPSSFARKCSG